MKIKKLSKVVAILITLAVFMLSVSPVASALLNKNGSITVNLTNSETGKPLSNASFRLYFVAKAYENGNGLRYKFVHPYDKANIDLDDLQDSYLPIHLAFFATSSSQPFTEKISDKNGVLVFDNLEPGLYLVVPSQTPENCYAPSPFVISVPTYDSQNKVWKYDIDASPKINGGIQDGSDTYISVVKKWDTDGDRPESITVVLLRDFKEFATVELNESNNWYYRWDNLPKNHVWDVVEKSVPDGFTVHYETSSNTVTIINKSDTETTTKPVTGTDPDTTGTTKPSDNTTTDKPGTTKPDSTKPSDTNTTKPENDKLAQTGQLNWPVPVFAIAGLLIFSIGWAILNLGKKESE